MSWTFTTSGAAIAKAGAGANTTIVASGATLAKWSDDIEGIICLECRRDYLTNYATIPTIVQSALSEITSSKIAKQIINYDMSGYSNTTQAQTMLDIQDDVAGKGMAVLKDFKSGDIKDT